MDQISQQSPVPNLLNSPTVKLTFATYLQPYIIHVSLFTCFYICIYYVCTYIYVYICICVYIYICIYEYICIYQTHDKLCLVLDFMSVHIFVYIYVYVYICIYVYIYIHIYEYTCIYQTHDKLCLVLDFINGGELFRFLCACVYVRVRVCVFVCEFFLNSAISGGLFCKRDLETQELSLHGSFCTQVHLRKRNVCLFVGVYVGVCLRLRAYFQNSVL